MADAAPDRTYEVIVTDAAIPPDRFLFEGIAMLTDDEGHPRPSFSASELAKVVFGRSVHWMRWVDRVGKLVLDGHPVGQRRTASGSRTYSLADAEEVAHALAQQEAITGDQLLGALRVLRAVAIVWGYPMMDHA